MTVSPLFLSDSSLAVVTQSNNGQPSLQLWNLISEEDTPTRTTVNTAELFADAPAFDENDALLWARSIQLTPAGAGFSLLVQGENNIRVARFADPGINSALWDGFSAEMQIQIPMGEITGFSASDTQTLVVYADGSSVLIHIVEGEWVTTSFTAQAERRLIAIVDDEILSFSRPIGFYDLQPPAFIKVQSGDPLAAVPAYQTIGQLPVQTYNHTFAAVLKRPSGEVLFADTHANPAVVWALDAQYGLPEVFDGAHRPLHSGAERLGAGGMKASAEGSVFVIRNTNSGNALYWVNP